MRTLKWINAVSFMAMIVINALANLLPLGGKTTGQISDAYPNLFTPSGVTFSIWGIIYILLAVFILYQCGILGAVEKSQRIVSKIGILFVISCIFNILWVLCWHSDAIGLSVLCITGLLVTLIVIQSKIASMSEEWPDSLIVKPAFDIYYGWIIAAAIANISVWLVKIGWNRFGFSETFWAAAIVLVGAAIGVCVIVFGHNKLAGAALIWAYCGILIKHLSGTGYSGKYPIVITAVIVGIIVILTSIMYSSACAHAKAKEQQL